MKEENRLKALVIKGSIIFLTGMLILTIISKTIYMFLLPEVTIDIASKGKIETQIMSDGKIGYDRLMMNQMKVGVKSTEQGEITKCYVQEGQSIKKGKPLFDIACQLDEEKRVQDEIQSNEIQINKQSYEQAKRDYEEQYKALEEKLAGKEQKLSHPEKSYEQVEIEKQIEAKKKEIEINEALLAVGSVSQRECDEAKEALKILEEKQKSLINESKLEIEEEIQEIKDKMKEVDRQITQQETMIKLEENKLQGMTKSLHQVTINSPIDGVIYTINVATGVRIAEGEEIIVIIPDHIPITLSFSLSGKEADQVALNKEVDWFYKEEKQKAMVIKKTYDEEQDSTMITCQVEQSIVEPLVPDYKTYKNVEVEIEERSEPYDVLVPTSAIIYENNGAYVYDIEEVDTIFEKKYRVHKNAVEVIEEGDILCAVEGIVSGRKIIATTNKELEEGSEVKLR